MRAKAAAGQLVDVGEGPFDLAQMQTWAARRTIRAKVLRYLLVEKDWPVAARGIRLRGARISGQLDLEGVTLRCPLSLDGCYLDASEPVNLDHASAVRLILTGCQLAGVTADMLTVREVDLRGSTFTGAVRLVGATIAGALNCNGAKLKGRDKEGNALVADGMTTGGDVLLGDEFIAAGTVRLHSATIAGALNCNGAKLKGRDNDGNALVADGLKAKSVFFRELLASAGAVRLHSAAIDDELNCGGAQLTGRNKDGENGDSLVADAIQARIVLFNRAFTAAGAVRLHSADIAIQLDCSGAKLMGRDADGAALVADGMRAGGDVILDEKATISGTISLRSARIGGSVGQSGNLDVGEQEIAFDATRAQITGKLLWASPGQVRGVVNLEGMAVGELEDDWTDDRQNGYWPTNGRLRLDGFAYHRFGGDQQATVDQRLAWVRSQYQPGAHTKPEPFASQPYENLAAVYRRAGQDTAARKVAIARRADLRAFGDLGLYRKSGNWLLDKTIKYGYQTWRAGLALIIVFLAFWALSIFGQNHHAFMPVGNVAGLHPMPEATQCTSGYPCFYPFGYAVDTVIPIINVHQAEYWGPNGQAPRSWIWVGGSWVATGLGWALATLLVTGFTGLVRKGQE